MSGFTHRVTNQIHGIDVEPEHARQLLEHGWAPDQPWLLRTLHEFAHVGVNFSAVGEALLLAELSMDRSYYDSLSTPEDPLLLAASRDSLSLAYDLLSPWSEAIALTTEFDADLTVERPVQAHEWMAQLVGSKTYDGYLWQARLSSLGIAKKANTLVSSCYERGHLLGHLVSRALLSMVGRQCDYLLAMIQRCVFADIDLAHTILDLAANTGSASAIDTERLRLAEAFSAAIERLCEELLNGPGEEYSARLRDGLEGLLERMQPFVDEFETPVTLPNYLEGPGDLGSLGRFIAYTNFALRPLVALGSAPIELTARGQKVSCIANGEEIYSFDNETGFEGTDQGTLERSFCAECGPGTTGIRISDTHGILHTYGDDAHIIQAFRRSRIPVKITEAAQSATAVLVSAGRDRADEPDATGGRQVAAVVVKSLVERVTGASMNLQSLSTCGVADALGWDEDLLMVLARLSNEYNSLWTPDGRTVLPGGPAASGDQLRDLADRLKSATGLSFTVSAGSTALLLW